MMLVDLAWDKARLLLVTRLTDLTTTAGGGGGGVCLL